MLSKLSTSIVTRFVTMLAINDKSFPPPKVACHVLNLTPVSQFGITPRN